MLKTDLGSSAFDVFCTANFLNFMPWQAAIDYLLGVGTSEIAKHNRTLVEELVSGINGSKFCLISPSADMSQSAIVVVSHIRKERNPEVHAALAKAGIDVALRGGNLRFSLHLYNTLDDVARAIAILCSV